MQKPRKIAHLHATKNVCKKVYFGTEKAANEHIAKLQQTSKRDKVPVRAYLCYRCNCWHLTSWEAPDIDLFIKHINEEVDELNAWNEREYERDTKLLSTALNELRDAYHRIKQLELEIFVLKNKN